MSLQVIVSNCRPSDIIDATAEIFDCVPKGVWEELNESSIFKGFDAPSTPGKFDRIHLLDELRDLNRIKYVISCNPEKNTTTQLARESIEKFILVCQSKIDQLELDATPEKVRAYFERHLGKPPKFRAIASGTVVPGEGIEIRIPTVVPDFVTTIRVCSPESGLSRASYSTVRTFLSGLPGEARCWVLREGLPDSIAVGTPDECLRELASSNGRRVAHMTLPSYDRNGKPIPA